MLFEEYPLQGFIIYISSQLHSVLYVDLSWDTYKVVSLKSTVRAKHVKCVGKYMEKYSYQKPVMIFCGLGETERTIQLPVQSLS